MRGSVRIPFALLVLVAFAGCGGPRSAEAPTEQLTPVAAQAEDRRTTDLVIFTTDTPGKGAWGIMQNGWHVDAVEIPASRAFPMPARLISTTYPGVVIEVRNLPEPAKDERVLADASGGEGVQLGVFFGGMERGTTADGANYAAFESYVGAQLWRLRFTATSKELPPDQLQDILLDFVKTVRPGSPMNGLLR
ncbi:MAG: hypothetical protein D6724_03720 [Armatimonadetes bacterium]|nr:MAG: hypothetical protein D6724_03720 [Armatimonadota bacterium]